MAEAIGLGASVLAFITITLKSAKAIHVVLSTIKDAPDSVRRLLSEVLFMQSMLERLLSFTSPQIQTIPASEVSALNHLVKGCSVDISDIATRLHDIIVFPGTDAARRLLKRLRAAQGDKDLVRMTDTLRGQASKLQLYLTMIHTQTAATQAAARAAEAAVQANSMSQIMEQLIGLRQQVDAGKTALRPELSDVIARLARLSREEMRVVDVEDIEPVMTDFQELLKATLDERLPLQPIGSDWPFIRALAPAEFSKDVKLFQKLFAAASRVSLNGVVHNSEFEELVRSKRGRTSKHCKRYTRKVGLDGGEMILTFTTSESRPSDSTSPPGMVISRDNYTSFNASISFRPYRTRCFIGATVSRLRLPGVDLLLPPTLLVNPIIPNDSLVFKAVRQGHLGRLKYLLDTGQASIRDQNDKGMSLLHYASIGEGADLKMIRFLLDHGLDVNDTGGVFNETPLATSMLLATKSTSAAVDLLLERGADPTITSGLTSSPLARALRCGQVQAIQSLFKHGVGDASQADQQESPLIIVCRQFAWDKEFSPTLFATLLGLGSSVHDRIKVSFFRNGIDLLGGTCLHLVANATLNSWKKSEPDGLIFLIERGADVFARTTSGLSVSETVYRSVYFYQLTGVEHDEFNFQADIWDAALVSCGYDLYKFRKDFPRRKPSWKRGQEYLYTRAHFERLWRGIEQLCPYWDDSAYPAIGNSSGQDGLKQGSDDEDAWFTTDDETE